LWQKHGVAAAMILAARPTQPLRQMLAEWVATARRHLLDGAPLEAQVPAWLRSDLWLFRHGGLAILDAIGRQDFDVWTRRPEVSKAAKAGLLIRAMCRLAQKAAGPA
jgi:phytoene/squalene synthetase